MAFNDVTVRIGAVLDRSFDTVMDAAEARAKAAARAVQRGMGQTGQSSGINQGALRGAQDTNQAIYRENSKLNAAILREQIRANAQANREAAKAGRQRLADNQKVLNEQEKAERDYQARLLRMKITATKEANRNQRRSDRESYNESYRRNREIDRFANRTSHRATRFFFPPPEGALGVAKRVGLDLARGAGVDLSLAGGLTRARERQGAATMLSNQGWDPDKQKFDERISAEELRKTAKKEAFRLGVSGEEEVMSAMTKFTDVTGDLATAKAVIGDIGLMARATGTNLTDAASAAADMAAQLPDSMDMKSRQETMQLLLNTAASQGKRGAVEVKDLARYVPKIVSGASSFAGSPKETMVQLLATAQIARRYGGASNGAQAATAVSAMVNTLKTPARVKAFRARFKEAGLTGEHADIYDKKTGQLRAIPDIIKDSIAASSVAKDPQLAFKTMWGNVLGAKGPEGLFGVFKKAGGGKDGMNAIDAEFKKFTGALDPAAQQKMLDEISKGQTASANRFQQKLDEVTEAMGTKLYPVLEQLAPRVLQLAGIFSSIVTWASANPFSAVVLAMTAAVARAGIESGIRMILDRAATSILGGAVSGAGGNAVGGAVGKGGLGLLGGGAFGGGTAGSVVAGVGVAGVLIGTAVAAVAVTTALLQLADSAAEASHKTGTDSSNSTYFDFAKEYSGAKTDEEREAAVKRARYNAQQAYENGSVFDRQKGDVRDNTFRAIDETRGKYDEQRKRGTDQQQYQNATGQSTLASDIGIIVARELTGVLGKTLNVNVTNADAIKGNAPTMTPVEPGPPRFYP
jgi:hypothetical protein